MCSFTRVSEALTLYSQLTGIPAVIPGWDTQNSWIKQTSKLTKSVWNILRSFRDNFLLIHFGTYCSSIDGTLVQHKLLELLKVINLEKVGPNPYRFLTLLLKSCILEHKFLIHLLTTSALTRTCAMLILKCFSTILCMLYTRKPSSLITLSIKTPSKSVR
jgi:hypothetical protein